MFLGEVGGRNWVSWGEFEICGEKAYWQCKELWIQLGVGIPGFGRGQ